MTFDAENIKIVATDGAARDALKILLDWKVPNARFQGDARATSPLQSVSKLTDDPALGKDFFMIAQKKYVIPHATTL